MVWRVFSLDYESFRGLIGKKMFLSGVLNAVWGSNLLNFSVDYIFFSILAGITELIFVTLKEAGTLVNSHVVIQRVSLKQDSDFHYCKCFFFPIVSFLFFIRKHIIQAPLCIFLFVTKSKTGQDCKSDLVNCYSFFVNRHVRHVS